MAKFSMKKGGIDQEEGEIDAITTEERYFVDQDDAIEDEIMSNNFLKKKRIYQRNRFNKINDKPNLDNADLEEGEKLDSKGEKQGEMASQKELENNKENITNSNGYKNGRDNYRRKRFNANNNPLGNNYVNNTESNN